MTEWTLDLPVIPAESEEVWATEGDKAPPDDAAYLDLLADALVDDVELDRGDWFS